MYPPLIPQMRLNRERRREREKMSLMSLSLFESARKTKACMVGVAKRALVVWLSSIFVDFTVTLSLPDLRPLRNISDEEKGDRPRSYKENNLDTKLKSSQYFICLLKQ